MSTQRLGAADLPWLPRLSTDFRDRLRALEADTTADWGTALRALTTEALGVNQAIGVAKSIERLRARKTEALAAFRLGLVSNSTTDFLKPLLIATAARFGILLEIVAADFGQATQEAFDPSSRINTAKPDAILLALDFRGLPFRHAGQQAWPLFGAEAAIAELASLREAFRRHSGAVCLVQTLAPPPQLLFGSLDVATAGTLRNAIAHFNSQLAQDAPKSGDALLDLEWLSGFVGLDQWYDDRQWYIARLACAPGLLPLYADFVCRTIAALRGRARKCLILDLDNTLWGGVIGDDGLDGIALSPGDARGESFRAIQEMALDLRRRGVVLAVCSKNDDTIARTPFRSHPEMLLKETDLAVFAANWDDKATNIERIARQLELGLDAMVLLDDNPVERAQVRAALPQVAVPEVGDDPSAYPRILLSAGYFDSVGFTQEDLTRAQSYTSNAERAQALEGARNLDDFLRSLQMEVEFARFNTRGRKRISQLINKTNQFNVTTRRYTEQQVAALEESSDHYTLQVTVRDKFGDNGMIGVVICARTPEQWNVDTWLMSCRVLNRGVEQAVCNRVARDARQAGAKRLTAVYVPTERNGIVADLFERLGFKRDESRSESRPGAAHWVLDLEAYRPFELLLTEKDAADEAARAHVVHD
jgi:FkbH-like protein